MVFLKKIIFVLKEHKFFAGFLFVLAIYRFSLIFAGHLFWLDELHYLNTFTVLKNLAAGDMVEAVKSVFNAHGRPVYIIFSLLPAYMQLLCDQVGMISVGNPDFFLDLFVTGKAPSFFDPLYFVIPSAFNVLVTLGTTIVFYRLLLLLTRDRWVSLCGVVVYSLLANTNLYIRHLLPYDLSLLFFLTVLYLVLRDENEFGRHWLRVVLCGVLTAIAFLTYPGNYLFVVFLSVGVLLASKRKCVTPLIYLSTAAGTLLSLEGVSRLAGVSFFKNSMKLAGNVLQGSFEEGYVFIFKYLTHVEWVMGYALLGLFAVYCVWIFPRQKGAFRWIFLTALCGYVFHATMGVVFHKLTIYGRLLHMYIPFMVLAAMLVLSAFKNRQIKLILCVVVMCLSVASFARHALVYQKISYPLDLKFWFISRYPDLKPLRVNEFFDTSPILKAKKLPVVFVNAGKLDEVPSKFYPFTIPPNVRLLRKRLHPMCYPAYQYEGYKVHDRKHLAKQDIYMKIYLDSDL
ncbi:hypothetical protein ACFL49_01800 [Candidatus Omnitrophota bacterium]